MRLGGCCHDRTKREASIAWLVILCLLGAYLIALAADCENPSQVSRTPPPAHGAMKGE